MDKRVAEAIILAQVASDGGKRIHALQSVNPDVWYAGYEAKDEYIREAITRIQKCHGRSGFSFYVTSDVEGRAFYIVYFNFKVDGRRYQVSFHTFDVWMEKRINKSHATRWDDKSSREAVIRLIEMTKRG